MVSYLYVNSENIVLRSCIRPYIVYKGLEHLI